MDDLHNSASSSSSGSVASPSELALPSSLVSSTSLLSTSIGCMSRPSETLSMLELAVSERCSKRDTPTAGGLLPVSGSLGVSVEEEACFLALLWARGSPFSCKHWVRRRLRGPWTTLVLEVLGWVLDNCGIARIGTGYYKGHRRTVQWSCMIHRVFNIYSI